MIEDIEQVVVTTANENELLTELTITWKALTPQKPLTSMLHSTP